MAKQHTTITIRVPAALAEALDAMVKLEEKRTGLPVGRSGIVRRAIEHDLQQRGQQPKPTEVA